jgi:hypothetical protein
MSRTIKAIMRHMTPKPATPAAGTAKPVTVWQRGPETLSGLARRKLRLAFATSPSPAFSKH